MRLAITLWIAAGFVAALPGCTPRTHPASPTISTAPHRTNADGLALIKDFEKFRPEPYRGVSGRWLIGYGHTLTEEHEERITRERADELLRADLALCEQAIRDAVTVAVTSNAFSAMASLCHTIGVPAFVDSSVVTKLNQGDRQAAADAFLLFTKAEVGGKMKTLSNLEERRTKERALFLRRERPVPTS